MREFLRQVFILNNRWERSWHVARLDYARWHTCLNCAKVGLDEVAYLWESDGQLIAFLVSDGERGEAHFCVHPGQKTGELEEEMLDVAENHMAAVESDSTHRLRVWSPGQDKQRQGMFIRRGYRKSDWHEHQWRRQLDAPVTATTIAPGYTIRPLGDGLELLERC